MLEHNVTVETSPQRTTLYSTILTGLIIGLVQVIFAVSLASLVFSGSLVSALPRGIAIALVSINVSALMLALFSVSSGVLGNVQENPAVLIAVAAGSLATMLGSTADLIASVIALIVVTTLLTGGLLLLLGTFQLGELVRYLPYPVIGGFLAGTGWLLAQGAVGAMADYPLTWSSISALLTANQILLWLPGILFGLILFASLQRFEHPLVLPALLAGGIGLFYLILTISGISPADAMNRGLILGQVGAAVDWRPFPISDLMLADWHAVAGQAGTIGTIGGLTAVTLLLNISGIELILRDDIDLNRELRTTGFSNLLSGLAGGMIGFHTLSLTALSHNMGAGRRVTGVIVGLVPLLIVFVGPALLAYTPMLVVGGLLFFLGLDFLYDWLIKRRSNMTRLEYAVVLLIVVIIAIFGFLVGIGVGLVIMIGIFLVNYSRTNIFHHVLSGAEMASKVERNAYHRHALVEMGRQIHILQLRGFIFFGTANLILEAVKARLDDDQPRPLAFLIIDFRRVTGLDSSAAFSFSKVLYLAQAHDFTMIFTHISAEIEQHLWLDELTVGDHLMRFPDTDQAVEWCEDALLERDRITKVHLPTTLALQLADSGFSKSDTKRLKRYLKRLRFEPEDILIQQGEAADWLYFIELGQVSVYLQVEGERRVRLQTLGMGTIIGELGFFLNTPRTASAQADESTMAYRLTREAWQEMAQKEPDLALALRELMLRLVSERLQASNREIAALNR